MLLLHKSLIQFCVAPSHPQVCVAHKMLECKYITAIFQKQRCKAVPKLIRSYLYPAYLTMFSIGMMAGGVSKDSKTAGIIASLLYFPMLIFSGATLPYEVMPSTLQKIADIMPLTQGIKILKNASLGLASGNVMFPVIIMILITLVCSIITINFFKWE